MWILGNIIIIGILVWAYRRQHNRGWFRHEHLKVPMWISLILSFFGIFIPVTPFVIDGMILGALVYFGNEWIYQKCDQKWSPLAKTFSFLKKKGTVLQQQATAKVTEAMTQRRG